MGDRYEDKGHLANKLNYVIIAVIIFGVLGYSLFFGATSVSCSVNENELVFTGPGNNSLIVPKSDVDSVEYRDGFPQDYTLLEGAVQEGKNLCGLCKNAELGEFQAYLRTNINGYMIFHVGTTQILYNVESPETTRQFAETLNELFH